MVGPLSLFVFFSPCQMNCSFPQEKNTHNIAFTTSIYMFTFKFSNNIIHKWKLDFDMKFEEVERNKCKIENRPAHFTAGTINHDSNYTQMSFVFFSLFHVHSISCVSNCEWAFSFSRWNSVTSNLRQL